MLEMLSITNNYGIIILDDTYQITLVIQISFLFNNKTNTVNLPLQSCKKLQKSLQLLPLQSCKKKKKTL